MKIQDFFKEAFYINLDSRPDRDILFQDELKKHGLDGFVKRVSACTPKLDDIGPGNTQQEITLIHFRKHGACGRSHKNLVKYAKDKNLDNILIFEDDAAFYNDGNTKAIELIENSLDVLATIPDWDIFYMGGIILQDEIDQPVGNLLKVDITLTTHAWAINKRCYNNVLKYNPGDGYQEIYDSPIDGCLGNDTKLNKYLTYPLAVYQRENVVSDCNYGRLTDDVSQWLKNYNKKVKQK